MRARNLTTAALALLGVSGFTVSASAQTAAPQGGFGINRFDPSERGSEWFVQDTLDLRGNGRFAIGLPTEWSYRSLVNYDSKGDIRESIVRNMIVTHPGFSVVLFDRLRLGASLPIQLLADGHTAYIDGVTYLPPQNAQAIGDLRLGADLRIVGKAREPFTLAVGAQVYLPTGDKDAFAGDGKVRVQPRIQAAGEIGVFLYSARIGYQYRARDELYANNGAIGQELTFGGAVGLRVADTKLVVGPEVWGSTVLANPSGTDDSVPSPVFKKRTTPVEGLLGAHYTIGKDVRVGAGIGTGLGRGYGSPVVRGVANIEWAPAFDDKPVVTDRDGDGIEDGVDACPDQPGVRSDDPTKNGCPADKDGDTILDAEDACPEVPGIKTDDPKTNGCPSDKDHDGIYDQVDACVDTPGDKSDDPKKNGCPSDRDGDGVIDKDDKCPDQPGKPELQGCPDPDRDKDGIENEKDACPDEPGKADTDPKRNGCPKAFIKEGKIKILDQVKFKTGSAEIQKAPDSDAVLEAVSTILKAHPEIKKIRVEGHTDNKGVAKSNLTLSKNRAASVVKWLVKSGIDKTRLDSEGYGQDRPIDSNTTEEGRKNNRRVEFNIVDGASAGATDAPKTN